MKPFWKSRKFGYTLGTLLAALLLALLGSVDGVDADVQAALNQFMPTVIVMGVLLVTGHTITDVAHTYAEGVAGVELKDAILEFMETILDAILEVEDDEDEGDAGALAPHE